MSPTRIILLLVALLAGGLAAWLATQGGGGDTQVAEQPARVVQEPTVEVLVAATEIGMAQRLDATNLAWEHWPVSAVRPEFVTIEAMPDATTALAGAVARFEFFPGEPIRQEKLVRSEQGYLSAVLAKGMRGVSIPVVASAGAGGFIVPNDRVDVVLTRPSESGEVSQTILNNVRVLAIGQRLGERGTTGAPADPANPRAEIFVDQTIATLELDPGQSETLINSAAIGNLSLVLRSVADFNDSGAAQVRGNSNAPIRLIRFGNEASVISSGSGPAMAGAPPVDTAGLVDAMLNAPATTAPALPAIQTGPVQGALPAAN